MSVSLTLDAVRDRTKTVTRRRADTWKTLKPGDRLTLVEKGMGLPKGAEQVVVAEVEVVAVDVQPIGDIDRADVEREGFSAAYPLEFAAFWLRSHGYTGGLTQKTLETPCRRIEWRYLEDG